MWKNTLNVRSKNPQAQTIESIFAKIISIRKSNQKVQISVYNQPIYQSNTALQYEE